MGHFKSLLVAAAVTSLLAGMLLTLIQQARVIPIIEQAENYEVKRTQQQDIKQNESHEHHSHVIAHDASQDYAWMPKQGLQRHTFTLLSNVVIALGFTLILAACVQLAKRKMNWRNGLAWGLAGFSVFFLAPAFGMTPILPGMDAVDVGQRQLWWLLASASTAVALALLIFKRGWPAKLLGMLILLLPHVIGAPPQASAELVPMDLIQAFFISSLIANSVFWLAMGGFYGYFHNKWVKQ